MVNDPQAQVEMVPPAAPYGELRPMTLTDLESIALAKNPTLAQAAAGIAAARGAALQAGLYPNPTLGYSANEVGNEGRAGQQGMFLQQEFVTAGKLKLSRRAASQQVLEAEALFDAQRRRVLNDVRSIFYDVLVAQRTLELSTELVRVGNEGVRAAEDLLRAQEVSRGDLLQARVEADTARLLLVRAENRRQAAWRSLTAVMGTPHMTAVPIDGDLDTDLPNLQWEQSLSHLLSQSPELAAGQAAVQQAGWNLARAQAEPFPNVDVQAGTQYDTATEDQVVNLQVGLPVPLFNRNQGGIRRAQAEWNAARANVARIELDLQNRLAAAFERYSNARQQVEIYKSTILPNARASLDLTTLGYRQGEFAYPTLLISQRTFFQTNLTYLEALRELRQSAVAIDGMLLSGSLSNVPGR